MANWLSLSLIITLYLPALYLTGASTVPPTALWPLTDKYDNPVADITGNGNDGRMHNLTPFHEKIPGTDTKGYRFSGYSFSYVEIPNDGSMSPMDFTVAVYLYRENDKQAQIFGWDDPSKPDLWGTHFWAWDKEQLWFRPVTPNGKLQKSVRHPGLKTNEWVLVVASYYAKQGYVNLCVWNDCRRYSTDFAQMGHKTIGPIHLGVHKGNHGGWPDTRYYKGSMACMAYYDRYFQDLTQIDFADLREKCFD